MNAETASISIDQSMVRTSSKPTSPLRVLGTVVAAPFAVLAAPLVYLLMLNKERSSKMVSYLLPTIMSEQDKAMRNVKEELLKGIQGDVLDFGCADGGWLHYYSTHPQVNSVLGLEPNKNLHVKLSNRVRSLNDDVDIDVSYDWFGGFAEDLLAERKGEQFDTIIFGNVLCEVPSQHDVLKTIDALLKPGGTIRFMEHVRRDDGWGTVQDVVNPFWSVISDGCNCA